VLERVLPQGLDAHDPDHAKELLDLKICDMACGSGAFLVQACRYLSERLVEAWEDAETHHSGVPGITPEGVASTGVANERLISADTNERLAYARRIVARRCLYGVDNPPLAAEMAKLSLWLRLFANIERDTQRLNYAADRLLAASWQPAKAAERLISVKTGPPPRLRPPDRYRPRPDPQSHHPCPPPRPPRL
jgi:hypothetical protein